jgi:hypothetical protein
MWLILRPAVLRNAYTRQSDVQWLRRLYTSLGRVVLRFLLGGKG